MTLHPSITKQLWVPDIFVDQAVREGVKYYFADFVRKGGTPTPLRIFFPAKKELRIGGVPPPSLRTKFSQKKSYRFGGYPSPFTDFSPEIFLQKGLKMVFFAQKTPDFDPKK